MSPPRPVLALREAARLINVWAEHGHEDTKFKALAQWTTQTASLTPRTPRPSAGLDTLVLLDLVEVRSNGIFRARDAIRSTSVSVETPEVVSRSPDQLPFKLRQTVLERLFQLADCAAPLRDALAYARLDGGGLQLSWRTVSASDRASPAWLWLQELDLADHQGEVVSLDRILRPFVLDIDIQKSPITQAELEARIVAQREFSWQVEELIVRFEKARLVAAGAAEYGEAVRRISAENAVAGYDVESYETSGAARKIEVKCCAGPRDRFHLSRSERETAERVRANYWIAWVGWAARIPHADAEVAWFRDPATLWKQGGTPWQLDHADSVVRLIGSDLRHSVAP